MFYLRYLVAELTRRWGKTVTISLGLGMASAIIITIISISQSLSSAQDKVLNPLQNVGTDIMVTRSIGPENIQTIDEATRAEMIEDNRIGIDLASLGNPGEAFSQDTFLPGAMLTFDESEMNELDSSLVADAAAGLIMDVAHQEGTVPEVTAEIEVGGEEISVNQDIEAMTPTEQAAVDAARDKALAEMEAKGIDPRSQEGFEYMRTAMDAAMPERFKSQTFKFTTPKRIITQDVGPISTNIQTQSFTVAGVDTDTTDIGLILPSQIVSGTWFTGPDQVIANKSYAEKNSYTLGGTVKLGGKDFTLVGIVEPQLYTNTADLYMPLDELQTLSGREDRINVILIKSVSADSVNETSQAMNSAFAGAQVTDSQDTAEEVTGSLVTAANVTNNFIGITSIIVIVAAFVIASLLTVLSVNKRIREIGTLKAIGWSNSRIVVQIIGENVVFGIIGAIAGVAFAVGAIFLLNQANISLSATIGNAEPTFGIIRRFAGGPAAETTAGTTTSVTLAVAYSMLILLLGAGVAFVGSILSGTVAAFKASKMKPQEALRNIE